MRTPISIAVLGLCLFTYPFSALWAENRELEALRVRVGALENSSHVGTAEKWSERFTVSGLIEAEAAAINADAGDSSDITLATLELGVAAKLSDSLETHFVLLHEEGEEEFDLAVDHAVITYKVRDVLSINTGKLYLPFGNFETNMISDPLTLEVGEIADSALLLSYQADGVSSAFYLFNGDVAETGKDDKIDTFGFNVAYAAERGDFSYQLGVSYINNLADTDGIALEIPVQEYTGGIALHGSLKVGNWDLIAEYIAATEEFEAIDLAFGSKGAKLSAYKVEVGYGFNCWGKEAVAALGIQGTDEAVAIELSEQRWLAALSFALDENSSLGFEYMTEDDYAVSDGGSGDSTDTFTIQLAVAF